MSPGNKQPIKSSSRPPLTIGGGLSIHLPASNASFGLFSSELDQRTQKQSGIEIRVPGAKKPPLIQIIGRKLVQESCRKGEGNPATLIRDIIARILLDVPQINTPLAVKFTGTDTQPDNKTGGKYVMLVPNKESQETIHEIQRSVTDAILAESGIKIDAPVRRMDMTVARTDVHALDNAASMLDRYYRSHLPMDITLGAATFSPDPRVPRLY